MKFAKGLLATLVLVLIVGYPAWRFDKSTANPGTDETTITEYVADFDVAANGDLDVTETLTVNFPYSGKHGIFRFFDAVDDSAPYARHVPTDLQVGRDGQGEQADLSTQDAGRFTVLRIGSPDVTLEPGLHTYVIRYHIDGVLQEGRKYPTQFYWDLIPGGWQQAIESADLTVNLPVDAQDARCAQGFGAGDGCTATGTGTQSVNVQTQNLPPHTPVTVQIGLDMPTPPPGKTLPWTARFDPVLGNSLPVAVVILLLALFGGLVGFMAGLRSREPKPPYPLQYVPPTGIGPAQGAYIFTEDISRTSYIASIMEAAEKGAVDLTRDGSGWTLVDKNGEAGWAKTDEITSRIGRLVGGPGGSFTTGSADIDSGQKLQSQIASFDAETRDWAKRAGLMTPSGLKGLGGGLVVAGFVLAFAILIWSPFDITALALIPGLFAIAGLPLLLDGSGTRRTAAGRDLWSKVGGFHRVLSTPSSKNRFDFSGRQDVYTTYLPWAVALGCAAEWAKKYRTETGTEPPVPTYFAAGYSGDSPGAYVDHMVSDFSSTVDSAISSYEATQSSDSSSSSGGGGGFSGGGGGGGGGGGSW